MVSRALRVGMCCAFLTMGLASQMAAQDTAPASSSKEKAQSTGTTETPRRIEESQPSLYYLKDKQGNLQAVPNFTLEDFEDLYKLKHQLNQGDRRPRFSLQQLLASGAVNAAGQAELSVQCRILVRDDQWTRVPLRLDQAVLREPAQYQGPGEHFLTFEGEGEGYVAWIRGPAGESHQLTLKLLVPLTASGQETRLRLLAPRAAASELRVKVPYAGASARVSEGATLQPSRDGKGETELTVIGLSGDFGLSWRPPDLSWVRPATLEVYGNIAARLDARGVETDATFSVRSYGEPFDRFHIHLPPETELVPGNPNGYTLSAVASAHGPAVGRSQTVEVRLAKQTLGPVEVRISTKRSVDATRNDSRLELASFEVPEAARQWGAIAVSVAGDWQVIWDDSRGVRQVEQPPDALRKKDVVAAYDYFAQPSSLTAHLVTRKTRIGVDPEYVVLVDGDQVHLESRFRYTIRGAKVAYVDIAMPGWQIDDVGPDSIVAVDGVPTGDPGPMLRLPLASPTIGQFEIRLKAHRALPAEAKSISVVLPQPQASAPAAAVVAVLPADNVEILPDVQRTTGLLRQQAAVSLELPPRQQEPLFYRTDSPKAEFAAEIRRHHQRISAGVRSQVTLDAAGAHVEQRFTYSIAHEPTDYFLLDAPDELAYKGRLELTFEDEVIVPIILGDETDAGTRPMRMRVGLPRACIGRCDLTARYTVPLGAESGSELHVPLIVPAEVDCVGNNLTIVPAADQRVDAVGRDWTAVDVAVNESVPSRARRYSTAKPSTEVVLKLRSEGGDAPVLVHRAWLQTYLPHSGSRQDRLVVQLTARQRQLEIQLPPGAVRDQAEVDLFLVDQDGSHARRVTGPAAALGTKDDRGLLVSLPDGSESGRYVLSVQYHVADARAGLGALKLDFPNLGDEAWTDRMYWQVLLPRDEHLVVSPRNLTPEYVWFWNRFYFGRRPVMGQVDLEEWVGLPPSADSPVTAGMNSYLFSALGRVESCEIATAGRSTIVLLSSGIVLLAGLALIYLRAARHPAVLLLAAVALACGVLLHPELALIVAEAAVIGLVLALLAAILRRWTTASPMPALPEAGSSVTATLREPLPSGLPVPAAVTAGSSKAVAIPMSPDDAT